MNPAFLDSMSWNIAEVYGAITDQIIINLSHYFKYYKPGDPLPRSAFEYQAAMLAQMGKVNADTIRIIKNGLDGCDEALKNTLEQAIIDSIGKYEPELLKGVKRGILAPQGVPIVAPSQMRAFNLYYEQAADKLNLVNTVMLESTKSAYQQTVSDVVSDIMLSERIEATAGALETAAGEVVTGVSSWNAALKHATDKLNDRGITGFIDHAGHRWNAESYVAMDIRTTAFNVGRAAVWEENEKFGNDLYVVSYHDGARPLCYDWQNKVISALNNARDVTDLDGNVIHVYAQSETTYGEPAGLFGINCKHYPTPFIPGVSLIRGQPQSEEDNARTYKESQEQRRLERQIREEKKDLLAAKAQGATREQINYLESKVKETSESIDRFCDDTGRARHRDREAVYTKREFPDARKYDVSEFERKQKERIDTFFAGGGVQTGRTFGVLTPNVPLTPGVPTVPAKKKATPKPPPVAPATPVQNVAQQATTIPAQPVTPIVKPQVVIDAENYGVSKLPVARYVEQPTEKQIIAAVGGPDKTRGSCASVSIAYAGQKAGYDVLDFRDGASREFISRCVTYKKIAELPGVDGVVLYDSTYNFTAAHKLLKQVEPGKEYIFTAGRHAAVVRKLEETLQFLELQDSASGNGWYDLNDDVLRWRFGCRKSAQRPYEVLIDIEKLQKADAFPQILELINTAASAQRKGIGGNVR